jgi:hypothetical protein
MTRVAIVVLVAAACGGSPKTIDRPIERTAAPAAAPTTDAVAIAERAFAERLDPARLRDAIAAWQRAVAERDTDVASYTALARAWFFLADAHLDGDADAGERKRAYEQGAAFADRGLRALSPVYEQRRAGGAEVDAAAADLGPEDTGAAALLYWWGMNAIRWADLDGWTTAAGMYKGVFRAIERAGALDPSIDHAGPARFFGSARAEAPAIAGGSLTESAAFFADAVARAPDFLETYLQRANTLARRTKDRALFDASIRKVLDTPADAVPDAIPEQEVAKRKARALTW